jgi:transcription factor C subunit 6
MPRDLRPRKTRQSYTNLFQSEDEEENEPGPSQGPTPGQRRDDNGSDFALPAPEEAARSDESGSDDGIGDPSSMGDDVGIGIDYNSQMNTPTARSKKKGAASAGKAENKSKDTTKAKGKQKAQVAPSLKSPATSPTFAPAVHRSTTAPVTPNRQNYTLPNPNIHHRHRPVPLFRGPTATAASAAVAGEEGVFVRVERLQRAPQLFAPNETVPTNAYASGVLLTRRIGKAWGASVGAGPVWQIAEDLGWFREAEGLVREKMRGGGEEAVQGQGQGRVVVCDERMRRPRVYEDVTIPEGWAVLRSAECVFPFLSFPAVADGPCVFIDAIVSEMGSRICRQMEVTVLVPMALRRLHLHRLYLVTSVRLGNRPGSASKRSRHKDYVSFLY